MPLPPHRLLPALLRCASCAVGRPTAAFFRLGFIPSRPAALNFPSQQFPERRHVAAVVARLVDGRLGNKRASREQRMIQNALKGIEPNLAFADVLVPVNARAKQASSNRSHESPRCDPVQWCGRAPSASCRALRRCECPSPTRKDAPYRCRRPPANPGTRR